MKKLYLLGGIWLLTFVSMAQTSEQFEVRGRVTGESGSIPGVSVLLKGTTTGTTTDTNGNYSLRVSENSILVFSYVGFASQEIPVNGRSVIDVEMETDIKALQEVVVTALGIEKDSKSLGYATATVDADQIATNRSVNFMNAIQGKVPGLNISGMGTGPAGTSKIRIRGQSSFGGQNSPLIVVNGVPIDNSNFGSTSGSRSTESSLSDGGSRTVSDGGDGLSSINPDDIESMTVLKGAAASALYGSRAKDGVIMITTKSGGKSGFVVEYNSNYTNETPLDFTDFQYEYGQGEGGLRPTTANPTSGVWSFGEKFEPGMTQILFDGVEAPYAPVRDRIRTFYRNGQSFTNTISVSNGGEFGSLRLSASNLDNKGVVPNNTFKRQSVNVNFRQQMAQKFNVTGSINYSHDRNENAPTVATQDLSTPTVIYSLSNSMPFDLLESEAEDEFGNERIYSRFRNRTNPYFVLNNHFNHITRDRVFGNVAARYNFTDWLYAQVRMGQDYTFRFQEDNGRPTGAASLGVAPAGFVNGEYRQDATRIRETNYDFIVGANQEFGVIGVDLTLGGNQMYRGIERNRQLATDFVVRDLYTLQNARVVNSSYDIIERKVNSIYGAAEINYKAWLYLNATLRNDWFSTLAPELRSISYPSLTGSFVFSQAFQNLPSWLYFGKVRAAYAEVGSDTDVSPYSNNLFFGTNANLYNGKSIGSVSGDRIPSSTLSPMRVKEWEFGLETKLFDNRVGLEISFYDKVTEDQILQVLSSNTSGYTSKLQNVGKSKNNGVEMLLSLTPVQTSNLQWNVSFNAAFNESEVIDLGEGVNEIVLSQGEVRGQLWHVLGAPLGQLRGIGYLKDDNGNIIHDSNNGNYLTTPEYVALGQAIPKWVGGIFNSVNFKGITLSVLVDFKLGHDLFSTTNFNAWRHGLHKGTLVGRETGLVVGEGVNEEGQANTIGVPVDAWYGRIRGTNLMEPFSYNAGFWKIRQMSLGYDFTKHLSSVAFINGLRLDFVANNVLILKKWTENIDPEQASFSSDNLSGIEDPALPPTRSLGFNLNVKF